MYGVVGFMLILMASWFHSVNPSRSFWSNFERMEGLVTLLYMAALFIVASSTIKKREWTWVMNSSLVISLAVGVMALGDFKTTTVGTAVRLSGTLGNSSYVGVYTLIHVFLALLGILMIFRGKREEVLLTSGTHEQSKKLTTASYMYMLVYGLIALFNGFILFYSGTRGSFVGLLVGILVTSVLFAWKEKNKILRFGAMGILAAVFVVVVLLGSLKQTEFIKNSPSLGRFAGLITTDVKGVLKTQGAARTTLWSMAYQGVKEKPFLGWGQDTFGYVFAKHYNPAMYAQEQWFDRSHNVFLDWLISAGVLGLLGYLFLFVAAVVCIFSKSARLTVIEKSVLVGLLAAYFIHNLFVFDNLSSYILFFVLLAYLHDRYTHDRAQVAIVNNKNNDPMTVMIGVSFVVVLLGSYVGYKTIYQPYAQNKTLIQAMMFGQDQGKVTEDMLGKMKKMPMDFAYDSFVKFFAQGHTGESEGYEQLMNTTLQALSSQTVSEKTKFNFVELYKSRIAYHEVHSAGDPRFAYFAANFYDKVGVLDKAYEYASKAYAISPNKQSFATDLAVLEFRKGNVSRALEIVKKAYEDAPQNAEALAYYTSTLLEDAKVKTGGYDAVKLGGIAPILAEAYSTYGHGLILEKRFWDVVKSAGKKGQAQLFAKRLGELLPEKKTEFENLAK